MDVTAVFGVSGDELCRAKTVHGWDELDRWSDGELAEDTHARWLAGRLLETMRGLWAWEKLPFAVRTTDAGHLVLDALLTGYSESCVALHAHHNRRQDESRAAILFAIQRHPSVGTARVGGVL